MDMEKMKELVMHLDEHVDYPASKEDIVKACSMMSGVPEEEKKWFMDKLPEGTYTQNTLICNFK